MEVNGVSTYQTPTAGSTTSSSGATNGLSMDDFLKLLVAQLSNQDMNNTMDDTQFISQMAQFSMVQALSDLSKASSTAYSVSLIGKEATVGQIKDDGTLATLTGIVEGITLYKGGTEITIDGKNFALNSVMEVREPNIIIPQSDLDIKETIDAEEEGGNDESN